MTLKWLPLELANERKGMSQPVNHCFSGIRYEKVNFSRMDLENIVFHLICLINQSGKKESKLKEFKRAKVFDGKAVPYSSTVALKWLLYNTNQKPLKIYTTMKGLIPFNTSSKIEKPSLHLTLALNNIE